jgi:hypothetical protein
MSLTEINPAQISSEATLSERDWRKIVRDIHDGKVIPVIGPELVTLPEPETGNIISLYQYLAPRLAEVLGLSDPARYKAINAVACDYLLGGGSRADIYDELREILDHLDSPPSRTLLDLARITDFHLIISSVFDHQLSHALKAVRPDFDPRKNVLAYHPSEAIDVPESIGNTLLFHILGDYHSSQDFAVWEEDYMEFICKLIEHQDTLERLFRLLKNRQLLLLGSPANDWIVRFFLRVTRQMRLSERGATAPGEYLADRGVNLEAPLVFYFDKLIAATRVIDGDPAAFVQELHRRWSEQYGHAASDEDFLSRLPTEMPKDSVFISYASDNHAAAVVLGRALHSAGIPIWLDKGRLQAGQNYDAELEAAVRVHSSFFISLISAETEADTERIRYVHKERDWAAGRHVDGFIYYIPVAIFPETPSVWRPAAEPECFSKIHYHKLPNGEATPDFIRYIRQLIETYRISGRPRG